MSFFRTPFDKHFTGKPKRWSQSHSRTSSSESHSQLLQHGPETPPTTNLNLRIQMCRVSRFLRCPLAEKKTKLSTLLINHNSRCSSLSCLHWWLKSVNLVHVTYPGSSQTLKTLFLDMKMPCEKFIMDIRGLDHEQHFLCFASRRATGMVSRNIFQHVISN